MFYSGSGNIEDISFENKDFATSGRSELWDYLYADANERPLLGHGTGMAETATYQITNGNSGYPHNDWLLTYYDFGIIGVVIFFLSNVAMIYDCIKSSRKTRSQTIKFFFLCIASTFIPFMLLMYTDNIMVYTSFFGNIQYLIVGLAYGALRLENKAFK
jgi:O-antigen ligase